MSIKSITKNVFNFIIVKAILSNSKLSASLDFTNLKILSSLNVLNADRLNDTEPNAVRISSVIISINETSTITKSNMLKNSSEYLSKPRANILMIASRVNIVVKA